MQEPPSKESGKYLENLEAASEKSTVTSRDHENFTSSLYSVSLAKIYTLPQPSPQEIAARRVFLGPTPKKYTIALDLDETLIFSYELPMKVEHGDEFQLLVQPRPGAQAFLQKVSEKYEILIFTAAEEAYALKAVEIIDPHKLYIAHILSRKHCIRVSEDQLVKDLRILADRDLTRVLIADNDICNFAFQLANGIPVASYSGEEDDNELSYLGHYLEVLYYKPDIIAANAAEIGLVA